MKNRRGSIIINNVINRMMKIKNPAIMTIFDPNVSTILPKTNTDPTIVNRGIPLSNPVIKKFPCVRSKK
jgi:hypothetical protein